MVLRVTKRLVIIETEYYYTELLGKDVVRDLRLGRFANKL